MKTIQEMIEVMQAYADGKDVEFCPKNNKWTIALEPCWDWSTYDYRIKQWKNKKLELEARSGK